GSAAGVGEHVAQLAPLVNRTGSLRRAVAANAAGKRKLLEELAHAALVFAFLWVDFGVCPFQIARTQQAGSPMPRTRHEDHVEVELLNEAVQVDVDESKTRA